MTGSFSKRKLPPIHPGEILADALKEAGVTANAAALAMRIPTNRLTAIVNGQRSVSADTAMRLAIYFDTSARFLINLQAEYDLRRAEFEFASKILGEVQPLDKNMIHKSSRLRRLGTNPYH